MSNLISNGFIDVNGELATLTFKRRLAHPIQEVWAAITDPEQRVDWFGATVIDGRVGGTIPGRTYTYTADESGFRTGLLKGKKATVIMSRGWLYRDGSPLSSCNLQEPWIRMILGFVGITDIDFVVAEGVAHRDRGNGEREQYLKPIREQVRFKAGAGSATAKS